MRGKAAGRDAVVAGVAGGGEGVRQGDDNDAKGAGSAQLGRPIRSSDGGNNPGDVEVQV